MTTESEGRGYNTLYHGQYTASSWPSTAFSAELCVVLNTNFLKNHAGRPSASAEGSLVVPMRQRKRFEKRKRGGSPIQARERTECRHTITDQRAITCHPKREEKHRQIRAHSPGREASTPRLADRGHGARRSPPPGACDPEFWGNTAKNSASISTKHRAAWCKCMSRETALWRWRWR